MENLIIEECSFSPLAKMEKKNLLKIRIESLFGHRKQFDKNL